MKEFDREKYKLAAFDVDGTLVPLRQEIKPEVARTLARLREAGIITVVATGRDRIEIAPDMRKLFTYAVTCNGSCILDGDTGKLIYGTPFSRKLLLSTVSLMKKYTGEVVFSRNGTMPGSRFAIDRLFSDYPPGKGGIIIRRTGSERGRGYPVPDMDIIAAVSPVPVYKIKFYFRDTSRLGEAYEAAKGEPGLQTIMMDGNNLEITPAGVSKAAGLEKVCLRHGMTMENLAAFGDSRNDDEMLSAAGFAVVMENGDEHTKTLADYIAPSVYENGAATAAEELFGI